MILRNDKRMPWINWIDVEEGDRRLVLVHLEARNDAFNDAAEDATGVS